MPLSRKEQQQVVILGILLVLGLGILGYVFRDSLLPHAVQGNGTAYTSPARLQLPATKASKDLFGRDDYKGLTQFGDIPVTPAPITSPSDPFRAPPAKP